MAEVDRYIFMETHTFLPHGGGYETLRAYKVARIIYDVTYHFTSRFLNGRDRTVDQMVQAARSCKQNIAEGSMASRTSKETEIKLTNVAYASLGELQEDYEDYLRVRGLERWGKDHPRYRKMRTYVLSPAFDEEYAQVITRLDAEALANLSLTLIHQDLYMLDKLIESQQKSFLEEGGIRERMYHARKDYRNNPH